jgi:membrane fusion protein, heavy metal efflux system
MRIKTLTLLISLLLATQAKAVSPLGCLIEPDQIANVGSQVIGVTDAVLVERGDYVHKGQVLATLKSDIERANVQAAQTRSRLEAEIKSAKASLDLAKITEKRGELLVKKQFISQQAYDKSHAETLVAEQKLAYAREQLSVSGDDLQLARAQLKMRAIRSPIDGIVSDRFIWPGDRVEEKPLFKIVKTNPLRAEIIVPVELFGRIAEDDIVTIQPDMPNGAEIQAKVVLVDKLIDGASNTFRVRAEIPNHDMKIPSGLRCKATLVEEYKSANANANANLANSPAVASPKVGADKQLSSGSQSSNNALPTVNKKTNVNAISKPKNSNSKVNVIFNKVKQDKNLSGKNFQLKTVAISANLKAKSLARAGGHIAYGKIRTVAEIKAMQLDSAPSKSNAMMLVSNASSSTAEKQLTTTKFTLFSKPTLMLNSGLQIDRTLTINNNNGVNNQYIPQHNGNFY